MRRGAFGRDEVREPVDADDLRRAAAQHGEHRPGRDADSECTRELVGGDGLVGEVALHEVVVGDDDALDERVVHGVLLGLHLRRDVAGRSLAARVRVEHGGVVEELDDAAELDLLADRQLQRRDTGTELVLELVERA